jgi:hypothetical protein
VFKVDDNIGIAIAGAALLCPPAFAARLRPCLAQCPAAGAVHAPPSPTGPLPHAQASLRTRACSPSTCGPSASTTDMCTMSRCRWARPRMGKAAGRLGV